uniref:Uncharacterized protein n=1 Tax=Rhizophora mucronata TaxID=61149 RepID=A0A2P2R4S1_RHIMU
MRSLQLKIKIKDRTRIEKLEGPSCKIL